ncbi:IclR family transcriptional regulator [Conexibacter sp. S30A1]|uniref:IclR family transcriptional regulator n=1 Tax=Conexibacter sp. S30A1 TaxID=2937800 RepID=UPI00200FFBC6|nr:IclR family transcriptional regulator C-terminal domain-containing protein [Conexibacter sp. S30A1]
MDRVTRILEEVVYRPGMTFAELARAVDAPKSSVHGFVGGLLTQGWLYETDHRFYLGPAVYSLTLASGHIRAGSVSHADLEALHEETDAAVFLGTLAGDHLIYISQVGSDPVAGFEARSNIRRRPLETAGGKALLAAWPEMEREAYLRRRDPSEAESVRGFLEELREIQQTRIARNVRQGGSRFAIATTVYGQSGAPVASVTLVGPTAQLEPRGAELAEVLLKRVDSWQHRSVQAREAI